MPDRLYPYEQGTSGFDALLSCAHQKSELGKTQLTPSRNMLPNLAIAHQRDRQASSAVHPDPRFICARTARPSTP
jgi:hypothetical protein